MKPSTVITANRRRTLPQANRVIAPMDCQVSVTCVSLDQLLVAEMRRCWRRGERLPAEAFLNRHPELWQQPSAAVELVYEEYCLRQNEGAESVEADLLGRFPQWSEPLRVMLDCHRLLQPNEELPQFPGVGETIAEFRLLDELGRGARGRVFLANQMGLADRAVVLKLTPCEGGEHLSLARLQHTNIVPLYSCSDDPVRRIRILCMPYFGRATLTAIVKSMVRVPLAERTGRHIVAAMDQMQDTTAPAFGGAVRQMLSHVSGVQAMCWITACLADALQFAHERGVVHLDIKPSNILLSCDGQPMLLDFHLARAPLQPGKHEPDDFGGTPGYMAPEQVEALRAIERGEVVTTTVDGRADIYALGAMLYQTLGGTVPIEDKSLPLKNINPTVSPGLSDIVARCLAPLPSARYATASALADDLRRHLTDQPLSGVRNRHVPERLRKWRRRHPNAFRGGALFAIALGAVAILLSGVWSQSLERRENAEQALKDGQIQLQDSRSREAAGRTSSAVAGSDYANAVRTLERGLQQANGLTFDADLRQQLREELATAKRLQIAQQVHRLADEVRAVYGAEGLPVDRLRALASQANAFWSKRRQIAEVIGAATDTDARNDLQDIALFVANLKVRLSDNSKSASGTEAIRMLDEIETLFGPSVVLECQRQIYQKLAGEVQGNPTSLPAAKTAWEHYAVGRSYLAAGDLAQASENLTRALTLDPSGLWPNFYFGMCAFRMERYDDALAAFSVCIGNTRNSAACFYNRALVFAALDRPTEALHDYDRALKIDPAHSMAAQNRRALVNKRSATTAERTQAN